MNAKDAALQDLLTLIEDYHDFNPSIVQHLPKQPTTVEFARQVSKGLPCVYEAASILQNHAAKSWTPEKIVDAVKDKVEVAVTPNGRADALHSIGGVSDENKTIFLQPAAINMEMKKILNLLQGPHAPGSPVHYLQSQNSNLTDTPLQPLLEDLPTNFDFAECILGNPEAINIWIGDDRSVTSAHRDPYENLYLVLRGSKTFTLWAPVDEVCMNALMVPTGHYSFSEKNASFEIIEDKDEEGLPMEIPWVPVDPLLPRHSLDHLYPNYAHARPRTVVVKEGQMLYLPSGWYHHVTQRCGKWDDGTTAPCIAVNYWYDMDYEGEKHVMRQLIGRLTSRILETNGRQPDE